MKEIEASDPIVVIYEDRTDALIGVKLAILTLARHSPGLEVAVHAPTAPLPFLRWLDLQPFASIAQVDLSTEGWNVKPSLLLHHLDQGRSSVIWLDSDVVVMRDLKARLAEEPPDALIGAEDVWWGRGQGRSDRTVAWGLTPGRILPRTFNTGLIRVREQHRPVLEAWQAMLRTEDYVVAQKAPWGERPLHLWGDQEVLTALLGAAEWSHVNVRLLQRGIEIAQCYSAGSFSPTERVRLAMRRRRPVLVHAMGPKPWTTPTTDPSPTWTSRFWNNVDKAHRYLSPYTWVATTLGGEISEEADWLTPPACVNWIAALAHHDPVLQELPLAIIDTARYVSPKARNLASRLLSTLSERN